MDILAQKLGMDPAELRLKNFIKAGAVPVSLGAWAGNMIPATITPP